MSRSSQVWRQDVPAVTCRGGDCRVASLLAMTGEPGAAIVGYGRVTRVGSSPRAAHPSASFAAYPSPNPLPQGEGEDPVSIPATDDPICKRGKRDPNHSG